MVAIIAIAIACIEAGLLVGAYGMFKEQAEAIQYLQNRSDMERDEIRALTEAVARAGKVAVQYPREERKQPLKKSEGYWDKADFAVEAPVMAHQTEAIKAAKK